MHSLWSNTISNKIFDINYINNTLNYNFFNKYITYEIWLQNYNKFNFNKLNCKYNLNKYVHNYWALNKIFWSFVSYGNNIILCSCQLQPHYFNININNIYSNLYCKFVWMPMPLKLNYSIKQLIFKNICIINALVSKLPYFITSIHTNYTNTTLNISFNTALKSYALFFKNHINYLNSLTTKVTNLNSMLNTKSLFNSVLFINYIYTYNLKYVSNVFMYNWVQYYNLILIIILSTSVLTLLYLFSAYKLNLWYNINILFLIKAIYIMYFLSNILRVSKKIWLLVYIFISYYIINLFLYNEFNIEYINTFSLHIVTIFLLITIYFLYKYNIFTLLFFEFSIIIGKSYLYIFKQYLRDILNILAYTLRLILLFIRLNIYDGLDDFFDSYYIFIGDFNAYDYLEIIYIYNYNQLYMNYDNLYDQSILKYEEIELYLNLIYIYSIILFKFILFLILLLEGGFRLILASYIFILVMLEINNFNVILLESR